MNTFIFLSNAIMPVLLFFIVVFGLYKRVNLFDSFIEGAKEGCNVAVKLIPTMVGLFVGIGVLRASGFLDWLSRLVGVILRIFGIGEDVIPSQVLPVIFTRPFSSSAATGLALDLFETYGPDSFIGIMVSLILSCSETVIYTISVYFGSIKISKTGFALFGGLLATLVGVIASIVLANLLV